MLKKQSYYIIHIKTDHIFKYAAEDLEKRFDTSDYQLNRPLPKGKNEQTI